MRALIVTILISIIASLGLAGYYVSNSGSVTTEAQAQVLAATNQIDPAEQAILDLINTVRADAGVAPLVFSSAMKKLTTDRVQDMVSRQYYSHKTPDGLDFGDMILTYDQTSKSSCENLQLQIGSDWQDAVDAWVASPPHYACITNPALTRAGGSVARYDDVAREGSDSANQMYVFALIATN